MIQLTKRQQFILNELGRLGKAGNRAVLEKVITDFEKTSRITIIRDLNILVKYGLLNREGHGRSVVYGSLVPFLTWHFDSENYFEKGPDERAMQVENLKFIESEGWDDVFSDADKLSVKKLTDKFRGRFEKYSTIQIKKELERITVEFSWKSSHIEGNTYTLLDTERLIKEHKEAKGKTHAEAVMILNHKKALEYVWEHPKYFKTISLRKIEGIHTLISSDLGIKKGLRKRPVGITGTAYKPYDNIYQIQESVEALCKLVNGLPDPFVKAVVLVAGLSYIQPFEDGNKRTSRSIGNAVLLAHGYCPLSYRSIDEIEYKKAIILFYEQHSIEMFKRLFIDQYKFAVENYFL